MLNKINKIKDAVNNAFSTKPPVFNGSLTSPMDNILPENVYWSDLVHEGQVHVARMNDFAFKKQQKYKLATIISLSVFILAVWKLPVLVASTEPTGIEKLVTSPWITAKNTFSSSAPTLNYHGTPVSQSDDLSTASNANELPGMIADASKSLDASNKLTFPCDTNWNIQKSWSHQHGFGIPMCKLESGATWVGSVVNPGDGRPEELVFGVFKKIDGKHT